MLVLEKRIKQFFADIIALCAYRMQWVGGIAAMIHM